MYINENIEPKIKDKEQVIKELELNLNKLNLKPTQLKLIKCIIKHDGIALRSTLVKELKIPRTTIFDNLKPLWEQKLLKKKSLDTGKIGRQPIQWYINTDKFPNIELLIPNYGL